MSVTPHTLTRPAVRVVAVAAATAALALSLAGGSTSAHRPGTGDTAVSPAGGTTSVTTTNRIGSPGYCC